MSVAGNIPIPTVSTRPTVVTGDLHGSVSNNQCDILVKVKNVYKTGGWFVVQSCDGNSVGAAGVDLWTSYLSVLGASGGGGAGGSWIVLGNPWNAEQMCLYCTVSSLTTGWAEIRVVMGPAGGFTGGTVSARPTAPGEVVDTDTTHTAWLGTGPVGNPQLYAIVWVASDGSYTRTAWIFAGHLKTFWNWNTLQNTPTGWTKGFVLDVWKNGQTDMTAIGIKARTSDFTTNWGSGGTYKGVLVPSPDTVLNVNGTLESGPGSPYVPDQAPSAFRLGNQYIWVAPLGYIQPSSNGFLGYSIDNWWTVPSIFNDLDTMGDNADFIIFNQMILQWGLGLVGTQMGLSTPSTNYLTNRFYGRPCGCSPVLAAVMAAYLGSQPVLDATTAARIGSVFRYQPQSWTGYSIQPQTKPGLKV